MEKICTESDKQQISVLQVGIHDQTLDKHPSVLLDISCFFNSWHSLFLWGGFYIISTA